MTNDLKQVMCRLVSDLADISRPFYSASNHKLREIIRDCRLYAEETETARELIKEVEAELAARRDRLLAGPSFSDGQAVVISEDIRWWPVHMAIKPTIGLKGTVIHAQIPEEQKFLSDAIEASDYDGHVVVRFRADELGYPWKEGDDEDREFTTYNVPNWALRVS